MNITITVSGTDSEGVDFSATVSNNGDFGHIMGNSASVDELIDAALQIQNTLMC